MPSCYRPPTPHPPQARRQRPRSNARRDHTLYLFTADTKGASSNCHERCAGTWHPFEYEGGLTAGAGADIALLGTIKRRNGSTQVTYGGWPLYYDAADNVAGAANGQATTAFGGQWYIVSPAGEPIEKPPTQP